jgi:hypothetical protein
LDDREEQDRATDSAAVARGPRVFLYSFIITASSRAPLMPTTPARIAMASPSFPARRGARSRYVPLPAGSHPAAALLPLFPFGTGFLEILRPGPRLWRISRDGSCGGVCWPRVSATTMQRFSSCHFEIFSFLYYNKHTVFFFFLKEAHKWHLPQLDFQAPKFVSK